ncbi:MAG TPA: AAA family ATPase [Aliidongia sp.]|nr:AAA family ATPase [Aliidongia sp.]
MKRYILTGTPGAGKTMLLRFLEMRGHMVVEEAATDHITLAQAQGRPEPWREPGFVDAIVALQKRRQLQAASAACALQFFDRSPICCWALASFLDTPPSAALTDEIERMARERIYERRVFFVQNLGFCAPTAVRRISFADSLRFERLHEEAYRRFGYECVPIPPGDLTARGEALLAALAG